MPELLNAIWAAPLAAALLSPIVGRASERARGFLAIAAEAVSAVAASWLALSGYAGVVATAWVDLPALGSVDFRLFVDRVSLVFANLVAWISLAVFIFSTRYMRGDAGLGRYWLLMLLFSSAMELLVLSDNLLLLLFWWEVVGVCSFLLTSYWYSDSELLRPTQWVGEPPEEYPPSHCGLKVFLTTRFTDAFMLAGVLLLVLSSGNASTSELLVRAPSAAGSVFPSSLLLIAIGAMGKSAQLPFMEWLPDAMAGPSSVSALIHSATMVKAGVYLVARLSQLALVWGASVDTRPLFYFIAWSGAATSLLAALEASVASELKKALAYSTVSQLGYMMAALGACCSASRSAVSAAVAHAVSHALFKSAMFLSAGLIIHATGSRFLRDLSGSATALKLTFAALALSALSLMGVPPLAGFWSKRQLLSALAADPPLLVFGVCSSALTAFYSARLLLLLCEGHGGKLEEDTLAALVCLALASASLGLGLIHPLLQPGDSLVGASVAELLSFAATAGGAAFAVAVYRGRARLSLPRAVEMLLKRRLYLNALYYRLADSFSLAALRVEAMEEGYANALKSVTRAVVEGSSRVARAQVGTISLREFIWVLALLLLLLIAVGW